MEVLSSSPKETSQLAGRIANNLKPGDILALYGDLGSGKTTFTKYLVDALGIDARVQSPTFVLVREYKRTRSVNNLSRVTGSALISLVNHVDLYRLESKNDVYELGLPELFTRENSVTVIEWPKLAQNLLPKRTISIKFENRGVGKRMITASSSGGWKNVHNPH